MRDFNGRRYWIVGASEGLGRALAHLLADAGAELILSARSSDRLHALAAELPGQPRVVPVDVAEAASLRSAASQLGPIDGVVQMTGVYWPMPAAQWDPDLIEKMCDINFTGTARILGAVLPAMLARGAGHIVLTGSLSAYRGLPGSVGYGASKAGIMVMAESLHADLRGTGLEVQLANPGFIRTRLTDKNDFRMPFLMEPDAAAHRIFDQMRRGGFKRSFPAPFSWVFRAAQFLPDSLYFRLFS
ncbi:SDR family NAD(P)-dependent oxidoreductase [Brevirhabdus sp.]|uniref:SDR family NAD(P)-dependent oxidoreductase n=1 Tax=Brevirhabdus sp. TaxID=2004514 RepID=UPI004058B170